MRALRPICLFLSASVFAGIWNPASAEDNMLTYAGPDREQRLIEGAKKEGEVTLYSAMIINQTLRPLTEAFTKKYPFIKMNYWRAESSGLFTKISAEIRAGNPVGDMVEGTGVGEVAVQAGLAQPFHSPMVDELPETYRDPNGLWAPTRRSFFGVAYNTKLVQPADVPKSYEDLLDPKWKGRMAWHMGSSSGADLFATNLRLKWGEERALDYLHRLAEQKVVSLTSISARALVDRVIAGESSLALNIFAHHPLISHAKGAPVLSALLDPVATTVGTMIIPKGLRHPNATMLLADFILSREGQSILAKSEYFPSRPDVPPLPSLAPVTDALKGVSEQFVTPDMLVKYTPSSEEIIRDLFR